MDTRLIVENVKVLAHLLHPEYFDGRPGQPGTPIRPPVADFFISEVVRDVAVNLKKSELSNKLHIIARELAHHASETIMKAWDDGDDCGTIPIWMRLHWPFPPGPDPDHDPVYHQFITVAMNDILLAHALRELALMTHHEQSRVAMREVAEMIVKTAAGALYDEFVKTQFSAPKPVARAAA